MWLLLLSKAEESLAHARQRLKLWGAGWAASHLCKGISAKRRGRNPKERRKDGQEWRRWAEMEGMGNAA